MSCRIIITEWASPQRHGACETEKITESERSSTDCAGVHSHSVSIAGGKQPKLPAGSACISQRRSFHYSGSGKWSRWDCK